MTLEQQYARALHDLVATAPEKSGAYIKNLLHTLGKKGHSKLLPRIFAEFQQIEQVQARSQKYQQVTPEGERTRVLLELYRKLVATS